MAVTIVTRAGAGVQLTWNQVDSNFTNLNTAVVIPGGTTGQFLVKNSNSDYDLIWANSSTSSPNITIGTTSIVGGTSGYILYNNAGVLGNLATTGSGNVVRATSPTFVTPILGTPTSGTLTNCTGYSATNITGTLAVANGGTGTTTATGTAGSVVLSNSPTLVTPALGVATATTINGNTFTAGTYTLTGTAAKTLTFTNSLTLTGTDATTMTFPTTTATIARTDAAQTFTGTQTFSQVTSNATAIGGKNLLLNGFASGNANIAMANNSGTGTLWWITGAGQLLIGGSGASEPSTAPISITSAGATSITYLSLTGTTVPVNGIYNPATNTLGFATNTTLRMSLDPNGNLLIGSSTAPTTSNNLVVTGLIATPAAASTIASGTTISPTKPITFISGTTPIATITAPNPISAGGGQITLIPTGAFTTTTAGNIALASTAVVSKALIMTYDTTTAKWYPSY
jgi:hypothetical protein